MSTRDKQRITHKPYNMFTVAIDRFTESIASFLKHAPKIYHETNFLIWSRQGVY